MFFNSVLAVIAACAASSLAAPVDLESRVPHKFTVHQHANATRKFLKNGAIQTRNTYAKYAASIPENIASAAAAAESGSVTATPMEYDEAYLSPVEIGGQTLNLDFDTGSSDLWVYSSLCSSSVLSGHDYYTPSKSSSASLLSGYTWEISYADGSSASGVVYDDSVTIGGLTVTSQAVEAAKTVSSSFQQETDIDGLVGFGFDSINQVSPKSQKTWFSNIKSSLASPIFSADLKAGEPGTYDFGFADSAKYNGSLTYVDVDDSDGYWTFTSSGYAVGSNSFVSTSIVGIADTGTTLVYLPSSIVKAYYQKVTGASYSNSEGGYIFPCSATLPDFTVGVGSYESVIPGDYINYAAVSTSYCYGGIQPNTGLSFSIFGDVWLKSQYVVFDTSVPQLGVAAKSS